MGGALSRRIVSLYDSNHGDDEGMMIELDALYVCLNISNHHPHVVFIPRLLLPSSGSESNHVLSPKRLVRHRLSWILWLACCIRHR